jgi:outer membrane protein TolC
VDRVEAIEDESLSVYVRQVLGAYFEVERALASESFIAEQEASLAEASAQSQAAERLADERYRQGLADYITVLEAQRRAFDAESALISIRRQRLDNRIDLYLALGGGFDRYRDPVLAETTEAEAETEGEQDR